MTRNRALNICGITKHAYYYRPKEGVRKGRKPSSGTCKLNDDGQQQWVNNQVVVDEIIQIKSDPETDYGYRAMTAALGLKGFIINTKKVYRLMKHYQLLHDRAKRQARKYVQHRRVNAQAPLEALEMDIKYQWVTEHERYAFILTVIDCFTRMVLGWRVAYSIKQRQVKDLWEEIIASYLQPNDLKGKELKIEVRNDNDSRFAAKQVQGFFRQNELYQVFTHPYTPQENGHVESFHSILSRSLERKSFLTLNCLQNHLQHFYHIYNNVRLHGSLDHLSPSLFWQMWAQDMIITTVTKKKSLKHSLKVPHYQLSGNGNLRAVSSPLEERNKEVNGAITLQQPSV